MVRLPKLRTLDKTIKKRLRSLFYFAFKPIILKALFLQICIMEEECESISVSADENWMWRSKP